MFLYGNSFGKVGIEAFGINEPGQPFVIKHLLNREKEVIKRHKGDAKIDFSLKK